MKIPSSKNKIYHFESTNYKVEIYSPAFFFPPNMPSI